PDPARPDQARIGPDSSSQAIGQRCRGMRVAGIRSFASLGILGVLAILAVSIIALGLAAGARPGLPDPRLVRRHLGLGRLVDAADGPLAIGAPDRRDLRLAKLIAPEIVDGD